MNARELDEIKLMLEKRSRKIRNIAYRFIFLVGASIFGLQGVNYGISQRNKNSVAHQQVYSSEMEFTMDFEEEKKKLGLEKTIITFEENANIKSADVRKIGEHKYHMRFNPEYKRENALQHEMLHVKRMEQGKIKGNRFGLTFIPKELYEEWLATSYALSDD